MEIYSGKKGLCAVINTVIRLGGFDATSGAAALPPTLVFALCYPALAMRWGQAGSGAAGLALPAPRWEVSGPKSFPIQREPPWVRPPWSGTS